MLGINRQQTLNLGHVGQRHELVNTPKQGLFHFVCFKTCRKGAKIGGKPPAK
jgi:hypothetical protein